MNLNRLSDITALPSISIIVPNFNGGRTLEAALLSLIGQEYPRLEIFVVDAGSTDNSVEIIRRYQDRLTWWISEKDSGQSEALNKGLARATGEIVNWLCSDDILLPGSLLAVARAFIGAPVPDVVAGACQFHFLADPAKDFIETPTAARVALMPCMNPIPQPGCFFRRAILNRDPVLDPALHYSMDFELWNYFVQCGAKWKFLPDVLGVMNISDTNKTSVGGEKITHEIESVYRRYVHERIPLTYWHRRLRYPLERVRRRNRSLWFALLIYFPYQCAVIALLSPFYGFRRVRWMNWIHFA